MRLVKGLADDQLCSRIEKYNKMSGLSERSLGFYLYDFHQRGLCSKYGFASTVQFALIRMKIPPKKTRELLRISRALEDLPQINEAFALGRLCWSAVRELTRVAVRETEKEWLDLALASSLRQIERAVSGTVHGERPPRDQYGLSKTLIKVIAELPVEDYAVWQAAFDKLSESNEGNIDSSIALTLLARSFLERPTDQKKMSKEKAFQVVYHRCTDCNRTWLETDEGPQGVPTQKVVEREHLAEVIRLPHGVIEDEEGPSNKNAPGKSDATPSKNEQERRERQSDPCGTSTPETQPVPPKQRDKPNNSLIRRQILSRDGLRCAVPGCSNRGRLFAHHVRWKSHGGRTQLVNEVSVCLRCHGLIHEGLLQVAGRAPHGLRWKGPDGKPLDSSGAERCS